MVKVYEINGVTPVVHPSAYVHLVRRDDSTGWPPFGGNANHQSKP